MSSASKTYGAFIWHGFFLALTMAMLDLNTVFPSLIAELTPSKIIFGSLYSIMLGIPLLFNIVFSHYLKAHRYKRKFLLLGIHLRSFSFLGMAVSTYLLAEQQPEAAVISFFVWVFLFSISAGFASISYADIAAKSLPRPQRTQMYAAKQFAGSIAGFLGGLLINFIFSQTQLGFPATYTLSLAIGFVGLLIASLGFHLIEEPPSPLPDQSQESLRQFLRQVPTLLRSDRTFRRFIIIENMASFSIMVLPFYMVYARETMAVGGEYLGTYLIYQVAGSVLSNVVWAFLAQRFGSRAVVRTCITVGGLLPLLALLLGQFGPNWYGLVFLLLGFIVSGRRVGFEPYLLDIAPDHRRTEYLGIRGTMNIFVVILPIVGGALIGWLGYTFTFVVTAVVMLLAARLMGSTDAELTTIELSSH